MGIRVDMHKYYVPAMYQRFLDTSGIEDSYNTKLKFEYTLSHHSVRAGDYAVILNNEYYEDYNLYYRLCENLALMFDLNEDASDLFSPLLLSGDYRDRKYIFADIKTDDTDEIESNIELFKVKLEKAFAEYKVHVEECYIKGELPELEDEFIEMKLKSGE